MTQLFRLHWTAKIERQQKILRRQQTLLQELDSEQALLDGFERIPFKRRGFGRDRQDAVYPRLVFRLHSTQSIRRKRPWQVVDLLVV